MVSALLMIGVGVFGLGDARAATYNYSGYMWDPVEDLPLTWYIGDGWEDGLDPEYQEQMLNETFKRWVDEAPCAGLCY